ncbi:MAG TPA: 4-alpha-glucanotransferase, partial [Steroidobacteraceae bacterium]|nr:4-alpha-glucanotransferase [Steroidobacteraceae bacterium]
MRLPVFDRRRAGVLLPLSALDAALGRGGRAFIDWLSEAGFSVWQILPVGPTGADGSPYWVRSDWAGNAQFLDPAELPDAQLPPDAQFLETSAAWLPDYALFEALTRAHGGTPFWAWPAALRDRDSGALEAVRRALGAELDRTAREQYAFHVQWQRLRDYARSRGVRLFGDLPFYVAPSSAETWTHRELFQLSAGGEPAAVGGVPPDYFAELGQLWGNPVYDWHAQRREGFAWWVARVGAQLARMDLLRLDHFRALAAYWAVPAGAPDARGGAWHSAPGMELLTRLREEFSDLPLAAEDLGVITPDVLALRESFGLPGMRVLQFAFDGDPANPHRPYLHERASVVYTGTHDNDTTRGWLSGLDQEEFTRVADYFALGGTPTAWPMIRAAFASVARLAVIPMQDLLNLPSTARMNRPGTTEGNWRWRFTDKDLARLERTRLAQLRQWHLSFDRTGDARQRDYSAPPAELPPSEPAISSSASTI